MTLGARIRNIRNKHKLNQERFGELCSATKGAVSQWESDSTRPNIDNLLLLRQKLGFSLDWLLVGTDDKKYQPTSSTNFAAKEQPSAQYSATVKELTKRPDPIIKEIVAILEETDEKGRAMALAATKVALAGYTPAKANHSS